MRPAVVRFLCVCHSFHSVARPVSRSSVARSVVCLPVFSFFPSLARPSSGVMLLPSFSSVAQRPRSSVWSSVETPTTFAWTSALKWPQIPWQASAANSLAVSPCVLFPPLPPSHPCPSVSFLFRVPSNPPYCLTPFILLNLFPGFCEAPVSVLYMFAVLPLTPPVCRSCPEEAH